MIKVQIDWRNSVMLDNAEAWCRQEIFDGPRWLTRRDDGNLEEDIEKYGWFRSDRIIGVFYFKDEENAMAFKLRWT